MTNISPYQSPAALRREVRAGVYQRPTSGQCPGYVQCNLVILSQAYADDFERFCQCNPKPCPLLLRTRPGEFKLPELGEEIDIRSDVPRYRLFEWGAVREVVTDITPLWQDDWVCFLLGCSFSFEEALMGVGIPIRNIDEAKNVPMYRTNLQCRDSGEFATPMVVSMRPIPESEVQRAVAVSAQFPAVHGAPVHIGEPEVIGIRDLKHPDFGDSVTIEPGEVPVFWACGVTPQLAAEQAKVPFCITHDPGCMLVTDISNAALKSVDLRDILSVLNSADKSTGEKANTDGTNIGMTRVVREISDETEL